ncbi:helix-turn-helix transcriptional regulator [Lentilactobacillus senioris]|uniref:helix-turn-helix transcriptional regulator n=1 Tax=Lentilactobacillus senioris TaxID=931534 RepID=UPI000A47FB95|nr:helix-turn-helix transcriptional regulator [Lentilactobacillus senioris]
MQFATMLKQRRTELQMTQQEMADQLFVTRQTVSRWENNLSYPNLDTLVEISNLLNLSLDSLLKGEVDVVSKISSDVRAKGGRYKKYALIVTSILALIVTALLLLSYGRATQNQLIDRINIFGYSSGIWSLTY